MNDNHVEDTASGEVSASAIRRTTASLCGRLSEYALMLNSHADAELSALANRSDLNDGNDHLVRATSFVFAQRRVLELQDTLSALQGLEALRAEER
ncbi:hypothetical protein [Pseudooceanicola sp. 200-1SW]|uniref:hypothetical protein n=1 Tax=Pseudooceanicola sp. 200-1SW TaxID=3425949 RepID=UPI003D7F7150